MATITVSSNPSTTGDTLTVNFTTDATNITDILISKDGGSNYMSATSFTNSQAVFNVSSWDNGTYNNCKLKCVYTESGGGGGEITPETLTISNISNITQPAKTEFYIAYSTNIAVVKHEVSWDGGNTFYDKTEDVTANGTNYKFKHDNSGNAGTYRMAIRVTTSSGETKTSNVFTVTLNVNDADDTYYSADFTYNHPTNNSFKIAEDSKSHTFTKYDTSYTIPLIVPDGFNGNLTWTSSDTGVAIVEEGGIVSPRTNGNCTIRITDGQNYNDTYEIIVNIPKEAI